MKTIDRILQRWRIRKALTYVPEPARVIDVGAHEGELFQMFGVRLEAGFGVEPLLRGEVRRGSFSISPGFFPDVRPSNGNWTAITMLAVLEHIPRDQQTALANACHELLQDGGRVIITVPAKAVDHILSALKFLRLIDGMSLEEHYGFEPSETARIFAEPRFRLIAARRFQLGLNHLFVFERQR